MSTHRQLVTREFSFTPTTLQEAQEYATIIANSDICPEGFRGRPNDVLVVLQLGNELGLKPMQALRSLGSINGMPFAYGDGLLALVKRHPQFDDMKEWFEGDIKENTLTAFCTMIRKGKMPVTRSFSMEDAKLAGLWQKKTKSGGATPWVSYPKRMLQHRARGFAARDAFPDALYGLMSQEEAISVSEVAQPVKMQGKGIAGLEATLGIIEGEIVNDDVIDMQTEENKHIDIFLNTVLENNISDSKQKVWLDEYNVELLCELPKQFMEKVINHYQTKEQNQDGL